MSHAPAAQLLRVPFDGHVELLRLFLAHRAEIVDSIAGLLNAQRKPPQYLHDAPLLSRYVEDCFFTLAQIRPEQAALRSQLDEAHVASGFKLRQIPEQRQELIDPGEMMSRAFLVWQRLRWPGYDGRVRYAQTLFNVYLLRRLMLLAMRIWDGGLSNAGERLAQVQDVLDGLWKTAPQDQPIFVRDARWLFALAQSPTTDELHGYFEVAQRISETLSAENRVVACDASVRMAGGHLRSQLHHVSTQKGVALDEPSLVLSTRRSNTLDLATLIQMLVPLLEAYERAVRDGEDEHRFELADAICQGISPDPELFLNRIDLLRAYSMIEHLFVATDGDRHAAYTPMGQRHVRLLEEYTVLIGRVSEWLNEDCTRFRPIAGKYSPYGILYGYSSRLLEHIALKAIRPDAAPRFSLEDAFVAGDAEKLAWVSGWRKLPHVPREVSKLFEYPHAFAEEISQRIERALRRRVAEDAASATDLNGRLFILHEDGAQTDPQMLVVADLPVEYILSSDRQVVAERKALPYEEARLLHSRAEGEFLVSYETAGGWIGVTKDVLTEVLGAGRDAKLAGLPRHAADILKSMCPSLVVLR